MILDGSANRELGRDRRGLEDPPVGGPLANCVAGNSWPRPPTNPPGEPGKPLSRPILGVLGGGLARFKPAGSPVTHELDPGGVGVPPGFGLPAEELDILAVDDRGTETGGGVALDG